MPDNQFRILIAGHTGLGKLKCIEERVVPYLLSLEPEWVEARDAKDNEKCKRLEGDKIVVLNAEQNVLSTFYSVVGTPKARAAWMASFSQMRRKWSLLKSKPKYVFLLAHLSFQNSSQFDTPIAWADSSDYQTQTFPFMDFLTKEFQPTQVITLIDDVYSVQARLRAQRHFRLAELVQWRNVESLLADYVMTSSEIENKLPKNELCPFLRSPIFSVKQPLQSLIRYISSPEIPRVYLSYPISKPLNLWKKKDDRSLIDQINHFRSYFSGELVVFDPITINERPIQLALKEQREKQVRDHNEAESKVSDLLIKISSAISDNDPGAAAQLESLRETLRSIQAAQDVLTPQKLALGHLWPVLDGQTISPYLPFDNVSVTKSEMDEVVTGDHAQSEIDSQIRARDFRLIHQSDSVVVYRPGLSGEDWSTGTFAECGYARDTGRAIIVINAPRDAKPDGPFDHKIRAEDVITIDNPDDDESRVEAFRKAMIRVRHYSEEIIRKEMR